MLRLNILKISDQHHVLLFTLHHIIFDGLSLDVFLKELGVLYRAFTQQQPSPLQDLGIHYADYSNWQRERLTGRHLQEHLDCRTAQQQPCTAQPAAGSGLCHLYLGVYRQAQGGRSNTR